MADIGEVLQHRASYFAETISRLTTDPNWIWGWSGGQYNVERDGFLRIGDVHSNAVWFWHPKNPNAAVHLDLVRPVRDVQDEDETEAVPTGEGYVQWAQESRYENRQALTPEIIDLIERGVLSIDHYSIRAAYEASFEETTSWQESKALGFSQAMTQTFGVEIGGDAYGGKVTAETSLSVGFTQDTETSKSDEETEGDSESFEVFVPPGLKDGEIAVRRVSAQRRVQPMKYVITGWGDLEHGFHIGSRMKSKAHGAVWSYKKGKGGKRYYKSMHFDSFDDALEVLKGKAGRTLPHWEYFRGHPCPRALVHKLEAPLDQPFRQDVPYDEVGKTELVYL